MKKMMAALLAGAMLMMATSAMAAPFDITSLAGYQVVTTSDLNFSDGGWGGWSVDGKVVLGAKIISDGDSFSDFSVFRPFGPSATTPSGYTYGANEYGFIFRDAQNSAGNTGVQIELYFADMMAGYTITESSSLNYNSAGGWGGWSATSGQVVSGGGFAFSNTGASAASSQFADGGSVWPHYTFGADEQGWVVQNGGVASSANLYVISFDAPAAVPEPGTLLLLGSGLAGLAVYRRRMNKA